ncbi:MAG: YlxM family DNA-binding protein [Oscillospiraceae bacterium]|nr:YlxM family DNA-binding protein [Oscillospiraceae bacterium]
MKDDPLAMSMLFDFYGEVLTEKQKDFFDLYYNRDLSLGEIAENTGITRQGVRDVIVRATQVLRVMEEKLLLVDRYKTIQNGLLEIHDAAASIEAANNHHGGSASIRGYAQRIQELAKQIAEKT